MSGIDNYLFSVEHMDLDRAAELRPAWEELASRALEPNVFLEPGFALAASAHLKKHRRPDFLFVTLAGAGGSEDRLVGVFALEPAGWTAGVLHGWLPRQAALGVPLLDRDFAPRALEQALNWLARDRPRSAALSWRLADRNGAFAAMLRHFVDTRDFALDRLDLGARAELLNGSNVDDMLLQTMSRKHRKYLRLGHRKLAQRGSVAFRSAQTPADIHAAIEDFLALEASGWKGRRGTALKSSEARGNFARAMLQDQAASGKCHIDALTIDGKPVAMAVVLTSGRHAFVWKIAFDETYSDFSPGVQFMLEFSRRQAADAGIATTDSCAIPNHPMFSQIWTDRKQVCDIFIAMSSRRRVYFALALRLERIRRAVREFAKRGFYLASGRRRT